LLTLPLASGAIAASLLAGRSVVAAHEVHQKNAVSARRCSIVSTVLSFIA
jgi:hypothetical protein